MTPDVVVDVGNTRIKWGRCGADRVTAMVSLPHDAEPAWQAQLTAWQLPPAATWVLSGVAPEPCNRLAAWLRKLGAQVQTIDGHRQLPVVVAVDAPERVGLDRLLNAVAVNSVREARHGAIIASVGTAVTVDYVDPEGRFRGGVIFPGYRLMAKALHDYTARLPEVDVNQAVAPPATNTAAAIQSGIFHAVAGGVALAISGIRQTQGDSGAAVYVTGGDARLLRLDCPAHLWPEMTLEGVRLAAAGLPTPRTKHARTKE